MNHQGAIRITLPLPSPKLSPNARVHWAAKAKAVKFYREQGFGAACVGIFDHPFIKYAPRWKEAEAQATFYFRDKRRRDKDNAAASLKAAWDGIVDAGVLVDDEHLTHKPVQFGVDKSNPRVEIVITPLSPPA